MRLSVTREGIRYYIDATSDSGSVIARVGPFYSNMLVLEAMGSIRTMVHASEVEPLRDGTPD